MDTFTSLYNRLLLRCPAIGPLFAQDLIRDAFSQIANKRDWGWRQKSGVFYPATYTLNPGTVAVSANSPVVTGTGTNFTQSMVGSQLRVGGNFNQMYTAATIIQVRSATSLVLDIAWSGPNLSAQSYVLYQSIITAPDDFSKFLSVANPLLGKRLALNVSQTQLATHDPRRQNNNGNPSLISFVDYTTTFSGSIGDILHVVGTGDSPIATTTYGYNYPITTTFIVTITSTGGSGTATFKYRQDNGTTVSGLVSSDQPIDLISGVQVYFPTGLTYVNGDVFIFTATATTTANAPRFELWPRPTVGNYTYPYVYVTKIPDLSDESPQLPPFIADSAQVILETALADCARFPGPDDAHKNPYFNLGLAAMHDGRARRMLMELEDEDDNTFYQTLQYQDLPYAFGEGCSNDFVLVYNAGGSGSTNDSTWNGIPGTWDNPS